EVKHIEGRVTDISASHDFVNILIAVIVEVRKTDGMALLQMAEAACGGDILEKFPFGIAKHPLGSQHGQVRRAGSEVKIQPAVIVEVAEIASHREKDVIQVHLLGHIGEGAV